jgi:hypothetical protein
MTEPVRPPSAPAGFIPPQPPVDVDPELARKNVRFGLALFGLFLLLFLGTFLVGLIYLELA